MSKESVMRDHAQARMRNRLERLFSKVTVLELGSLYGPLPLLTGLFLYGKSIFVSHEGDNFALEAHRLPLETELNRLTEEAERAVGG